ncbi:hypothetical protein LTR62_008648 [Meristemomyces frigidus]|uniref:Uncharacterized protein n=1 Tax=Meristemomyces frigidus TaxID=1508187 RepID=A0AAN7TDD1_9PEZI|nr:hypothetical protein LTR62_008648 [Meristemomyces frigidus]
MRSPELFRQCLGKEEYYVDFLVFFQQEIEKSSWQEVVNETFFSRTDLADDMLCRLFAGFLHPIIHLGFGIEFEQPAIIAEGLAETAVHSVYLDKLFLPTEKLARENSNTPSKSIAELLDVIRNDKEMLDAPRFSDGNKLRDGVLARAGPRMVAIASKFRVDPGELERKTAEMTNAVAYYTAGAQREQHIRKYDFYFMHCLNSSIFFSAFLKQDWLSEENKVRLLNWKVWNDLAMYASRKSPAIRMDLVREYKPKQNSGWEEIENRVTALEDDGHASKLVRALAHGQAICTPYEDRPEFRVKQDDWLLMGHMAIDSVEAGEPHWVRSAGFDEMQAWETIPLRAQL